MGNIREKLANKRKKLAKAAPSKPLISSSSDVVTDKRAKTARGRRILKKRGSNVHEMPKSALVVRGNKTSENCLQLLRDIFDLRKPLAKSYLKKHNDYPFEDSSHLVSMCDKQECSLFVHGNTNKKRPFALTFGRLFNQKLLDMAEFNVSDFVSSTHGGFRNVLKPVLGSKPMVIFQGALFDSKLKDAKSLLMDFFKGPSADKVSLNNLTQLIVLTAEEETEKIFFRHYRVKFMKRQATDGAQNKGAGAAANTPVVTLQESGPRFTMQQGRTQPADPEILKMAMKLPKEDTQKKVKNMGTGNLGEKTGRIHLGRQDFDKINSRLAGSLRKVQKMEKKTAAAQKTTK